MKRQLAGVEQDVEIQIAGEEVTLGKSGFVLLWALFGLLFPRVQLYGVMAPFGLGLAGAVSGAGAALVSLTTGIGYLLLSDVGFPLRYAAALMLISGIRWVFGGFPKLSAHPWFLPTLVLISTTGTGLLVGYLLDAEWSSMLLSVSEGIASAGFCYLMRRLTAETEQVDAASYTAWTRAGWVLVCAVVYMSLSAVVISGISPANIAAGVFVLMLASALRERGGAVMGIVMSMAIITVHPDRWQVAVGYAFGGLLSGVMSRFGRLATAGGFAVAVTVIALNGGTDTRFVVGVYETLAASVVFLVIPSAAGRHCAHFLFGRETAVAADGFRRSVAMRLDLASLAMEEVSATVDTVADHLTTIGAPDISTVYRDAAEDVCRTCSGKLICWKRYYADTMSSLNDLTPILRETSTVSAGDMRGYLARSCPRVDEMAAQVSRRYTEYHAREAGARRLREIQGVVREQFSGMSALFADMAGEVAGHQQTDTDMAARVAAVCDQFGMPLADVVCLRSKTGRITLEILLEEDYLSADDRWLRAINGLVTKPFAPPVITPLGNSVRVTLHQKPRYAVTVGEAQSVCPGETVCGDAYEYFDDEEGRFQLVLSDGMGTGGAAAVDSAMTAGLTARMLKVGFGVTGIIRILSAALMIKSDDETAATLDLLTLDLFSGDVRLTKAGACATLLISGGRVSRIGASTLPIGILRDAPYEQLEERLAAGDTLLMVSDGAVADGDEWIEQAIQNGTLSADHPSDLAETVVKMARRRYADHPDDITALAIRVSAA